jgi:hypothetical protein
MSFIGALLGFGGTLAGKSDGKPSCQRENRKKRFTREKKAQRVARRINRA